MVKHEPGVASRREMAVVLLSVRRPPDCTAAEPNLTWWCGFAFTPPFGSRHLPILKMAKPAFFTLLEEFRSVFPINDFEGHQNVQSRHGQSPQRHPLDLHCEGFQASTHPNHQHVHLARNPFGASSDATSSGTTNNHQHMVVLGDGEEEEFEEEEDDEFEVEEDVAGGGAVGGRDPSWAVMRSLQKHARPLDAIWPRLGPQLQRLGELTTSCGPVRFGSRLRELKALGDKWCRENELLLKRRGLL